MILVLYGDVFKMAETTNEVLNIGEVYIGEVYSRDELFALCDWFVCEAGVMFGSVLNNACFRAEPDDIEKNKWCVKEYWRTD